MQLGRGEARPGLNAGRRHGVTVREDHPLRLTAREPGPHRAVEGVPAGLGVWRGRGGQAEPPQRAAQTTAARTTHPPTGGPPPPPPGQRAHPAARPPHSGHRGASATAISAVSPTGGCGRAGRGADGGRAGGRAAARGGGLRGGARRRRGRAGRRGSRRWRRAAHECARCHTGRLHRPRAAAAPCSWAAGWGAGARGAQQQGPPTPGRRPHTPGASRAGPPRGCGEYELAASRQAAYGRAGGAAGRVGRAR
jgi:hypothetical protein